MLVHPVDTADLSQLEEEEYGRVAGSYDAYMGVLYEACQTPYCGHSLIPI